MRFDMILRTARKELTLFFTSPVAYLFIAVFLGVSLFVVFWSEAFFARNIADVRPLFEWMPLLLLFLSAAITMRLWSEERRTGTIEFVSTVPVTGWEFVLGKFLACWTLLGYALLLTLPLPITVAFLGDLDWGPVWAGYLAAMLLGGAYLAMGLFVSAWSDSQIVSLLVAIVLGGAFYLVGTPVLSGLFEGPAEALLRFLGTGARFESITRGVLDPSRPVLLPVTCWHFSRAERLRARGRTLGTGWQCATPRGLALGYGAAGSQPGARQRSVECAETRPPRCN